MSSESESEDKILTEEDMDPAEAVYSEVEEDDDDEDDDDDDDGESGDEDDEDDGSEEESDGEGGEDNDNDDEESGEEDRSGSGEEDSNDEGEEEEEEGGEEAEGGNQSDDSSGWENAGEGCPICLNRFRHQDMGMPESCDHIFCLECIQEWARNVNTCPVDRQVFHLILGRHPGEEKIFQQFPVENKQSQEVVEEEEDEDPTYCEVCHQTNREDRLLLCDGCDLGYHCDCLNPPLADVPVDEWFCPECQAVRGDAGELLTREHRRQIARTRVSERVRQTIQVARAERMERRRRVADQVEVMDEDENNEATYSFPSTSASGSGPSATASRGIKRKITRKRKTPTKRKKRKTTRKKSATKSTTGTKKRRKKRKTTKKGKGKGKKKIKKSSAKNVMVEMPAASSVKGRIAGKLGLSKPPAGRSIPMQKTPSASSSGGGGGAGASSGGGSGWGSRGDPGTSTSLSILGNKDELYHFAEEEGEEREVIHQRPAIPAKSLLSSSAKLSHVPLPLFPAKRKFQVKQPPPPPPVAVAASAAASSSSTPMGFDLLGSILQKQEILTKSSRHITINRDGSLSTQKSSPDQSSPKKSSSSSSQNKSDADKASGSGSGSVGDGGSGDNGNSPQKRSNKSRNDNDTNNSFDWGMSTNNSNGRRNSSTYENAISHSNGNAALRTSSNSSSRSNGVQHVLDDYSSVNNPVNDSLASNSSSATSSGGSHRRGTAKFKETIDSDEELLQCANEMESNGRYAEFSGEEEEEDEDYIEKKKESRKIRGEDNKSRTSSSSSSREEERKKRSSKEDRQQVIPNDDSCGKIEREENNNFNDGDGNDNDDRKSEKIGLVAAIDDGICSNDNISLNMKSSVADALDVSDCGSCNIGGGGDSGSSVLSKSSTGLFVAKQSDFTCEVDEFCHAVAPVTVVVSNLNCALNTSATLSDCVEIKKEIGISDSDAQQLVSVCVSGQKSSPIQNRGEGEDVGECSGISVDEFKHGIGEKKLAKDMEMDLGVEKNNDKMNEACVIADADVDGDSFNVIGDLENRSGYQERSCIGEGVEIKSENSLLLHVNDTDFQMKAKEVATEGTFDGGSSKENAIERDSFKLMDVMSISLIDKKDVGTVGGSACQNDRMLGKVHNAESGVSSNVLLEMTQKAESNMMMTVESDSLKRECEEEMDQNEIISSDGMDQEKGNNHFSEVNKASDVDAKGVMCLDQGDKEVGELSDSGEEEGEIRSEDEKEVGQEMSDEQEEGEIVDDDDDDDGGEIKEEKEEKVIEKVDNVTKAENHKNVVLNDNRKRKEMKLKVKTEEDEEHIGEEEDKEKDSSDEEDSDSTEEFDAYKPSNGSFLIGRFLTSYLTKEFDRRKEAAQRREERRRVKREEREKRRAEAEKEKLKEKELSKHKISIQDFLGDAVARFGVAMPSNQPKTTRRGQGRPIRRGGLGRYPRAVHREYDNQNHEEQIFYEGKLVNDFSCEVDGSKMDEHIVKSSKFGNNNRYGKSRTNRFELKSRSDSVEEQTGEGNKRNRSKMTDDRRKARKREKRSCSGSDSRESSVANSSSRDDMLRAREKKKRSLDKRRLAVMKVRSKWERKRMKRKRDGEGYEESSDENDDDDEDDDDDSSSSTNSEDDGDQMDHCDERASGLDDVEEEKVEDVDSGHSSYIGSPLPPPPPRRRQSQDAASPYGENDSQHSTTAHGSSQPQHPSIRSPSPQVSIVTHSTPPPPPIDSHRPPRQDGYPQPQGHPPTHSNNSFYPSNQPPYQGQDPSHPPGPAPPPGPVHTGTNHALYPNPPRPLQYPGPAHPQYPSAPANTHYPHYPTISHPPAPQGPHPSPYRHPYPQPQPNHPHHPHPPSTNEIRPSHPNAPTTAPYPPRPAAANSHHSTAPCCEYHPDHPHYVYRSTTHPPQPHVPQTHPPQQPPPRPLMSMPSAHRHQTPASSSSSTTTNLPPRFQHPQAHPRPPTTMATSSVSTGPRPTLPQSAIRHPFRHPNPPRVQGPLPTSSSTSTTIPNSNPPRYCYPYPIRNAAPHRPNPSHSYPPQSSMSSGYPPRHPPTNSHRLPYQHTTTTAATTTSLPTTTVPHTAAYHHHTNPVSSMNRPPHRSQPHPQYYSSNQNSNPTATSSVASHQPPPHSYSNSSTMRNGLPSSSHMPSTLVTSSTHNHNSNMTASETRSRTSIDIIPPSMRSSSYRVSPPTIRGVATSDRLASNIMLDEVKKRFKQLVEDAVRSALQPAWSNRKVTKEAYKDIFKKCVEKVCGSKETVVQQEKIQALVDAYVSKARKAAAKTSH